MGVKPIEDLDPTSAWFREALYKVLSWGMAAVGVLVAWLVTKDEVFGVSFCEAESFDSKICSGTWIVCVAAFLLTPFWIYSLNRLWRKVPPHPTRLRGWELNLYAGLVAAAGLAVLLTAVVD